MTAHGSTYACAHAHTHTHLDVCGGRVRLHQHDERCLLIHKDLNVVAVLLQFQRAKHDLQHVYVCVVCGRACLHVHAVGGWMGEGVSACVCVLGVGIQRDVCGWNAEVHSHA